MGAVGASLAILFLLIAVPLTLASPAALDGHIVTIPPSVNPLTGQVGTRGGYATTVVLADVAGTLTLTNADLSAHDVVSQALGPASNAWCPCYVGPHYCPLFASPLVRLGGEGVVQGTEQLEPGTTYEFFCSVHPWMRGTLVV